MKPVSADFQPPLQQIKLSALARTVRSFHYNQSSRVRAAGNRLARLRKGGFCRLAPRRLLYDVFYFGHLILEKIVRPREESLIVKFSFQHTHPPPPKLLGAS